MAVEFPVRDGHRPPRAAAADVTLRAPYKLQGACGQCRPAEPWAVSVDNHQQSHRPTTAVGCLLQTCSACCCLRGGVENDKWAREDHSANHDDQATPCMWSSTQSAESIIGRPTQCSCCLWSAQAINTQHPLIHSRISLQAVSPLNLCLRYPTSLDLGPAVSPLPNPPA